jgi:CysZ protein
LSEIWCGVRAQVFVAIFALPILIGLWILELLFPPAAIVTVPLGFMVASLSLAWNLFDYPLTLRGVRMRDRFSLVMRHKAASLGFGAAFAVLFWVPCFGILLLPVGAAAATRVLWRILETDPDILPGLPRPAQDKSIAIPS